MTVEINRNDSKYSYHINEKDPLQIDRRINRHGAKWDFYARRATPEDTLAYLLELTRDAAKEGQGR